MRFFVFQIVLAVLFVFIASASNASGLLVTCDTGGAKLERYDERVRAWKPLGNLPRLIVVPQYEYVLFRVSAEGFETLEQGVDVRTSGTRHEHVALEPVNPDPKRLALFAVAGHVVSRTRKPVLPNMYRVLTRNMTTYQAGRGQAVQDENPVGAESWYSNTLADLSTNRAAAEGDRIFCGVFSWDRKRCLGYVYRVLTSEDLAQGYVQLDIKIQ